MTHLDEQFIRYEKDIIEHAKVKFKGNYKYKDLVQDTYLKIKRAENKGKYKEQKQFLPWVRIVMDRLFLDQFRNMTSRFDRSMLSMSDKAKIKNYNNDNLLVEHFIKDKSNDSIEENETEHIFWLRFKEVYNELNPIFKEVMDLHTWEGMKHGEIAEKLDVSVNTSLGRYRYGVKEIRKEFNLI